MALPSSAFAWTILGRPLMFMLLEAKFFSVIVILADQYKRTQSLPWPLHRLPQLSAMAWDRLSKLWALKARTPVSEVPSSEEEQGSDQSLEMTQQSDSQVRPPKSYILQLHHCQALIDRCTYAAWSGICQCHDQFISCSCTGGQACFDCCPLYKSTALILIY